MKGFSVVHRSSNSNPAVFLFFCSHDYIRDESHERKKCLLFIGGSELIQSLIAKDLDIFQVQSQVERGFPPEARWPGIL